VRLAITLPISVLAGLVTGITIFREPQSLSPNTAPAPVRGSETTAEPAARPDSVADSDAKAQRLVAAVLRKGNTNERENEMYLAIEAFTAEDFRRIVGDVGSLKAIVEKITGLDWQTGRYLISGLIRRWLELDRGAVTAWAPRALDLFPKDNPAHDWMVEALTTRLPEEMLALLPSRKDASERTDILQNAMRELATKIPRRRAPGSTVARTRRIGARLKKRFASVSCKRIRSEPLSWPSRLKTGLMPAIFSPPQQRARPKWGRGFCGSWRTCR
jgi:hypothetical protein